MTYVRPIVAARRSERRQLVAAWIVRKYRLRRREGGTQSVARQLRKQGYPIDMTMRILGIDPSRK